MELFTTQPATQLSKLVSKRPVTIYDMDTSLKRASGVGPSLSLHLSLYTTNTLLQQTLNSLYSSIRLVDFLKVLRFSFPVPVVGLALWFAFAAENIKNLPLALRAREKI